MDMRKMSKAELERAFLLFTFGGDINAAREVAEFIDTYGKRVKIVKGKKVPIGMEGTCFWLKRYNKSNHSDPRGLYSYTRIGIEGDDGNKYFTSLGNVEVIGG